MASEARTAQQIVAALHARGQLTTDLSPVGVRPRLGEYTAQLWERRHFIWMDAQHRAATSHSRNRLGNVWLFLKPLLEALMYWLIFDRILGVTRGMENFPAFIIIGVLMFRSTMRSVASGPQTLRSGQAMIRAFTFPRAALPISAEIRETLQMVIAIFVMMVMIIVVPKHESPEWTWLLVPVVFAMQSVLNLGICFIMSRVGFVFPDTSQLMAFVARFLMYGSGVIFPVERFIDHPTAMFLIHLNPLYHMLIMYRELLMDGVIPSADHWITMGAWTAVLLIGGFIFFWRGEATYGGER
ncbi:ABC transporter permease [Brachybacterium phenoliresistens]|uniref:ABC transporter permease n=1 Tax=Brachybacterium phenoliresistens TaxID=396014 RepID=UPI0031D39A6C